MLESAGAAVSKVRDWRVIGASTSMTSINVARAARAGPSPSSTSAATTAPSTAHTSAVRVRRAPTGRTARRP